FAILGGVLAVDRFGGAPEIGGPGRKRLAIDAVARERAIPKIPALQPVRLGMRAPEQSAEERKIRLIHKTNLGMLVEEGLQQGGAGTPDSDQKHRSCG